VINVSAVNVLLVPAPKWAAYQASKTAFDQWFRSVGPELNARGVSTTSIYLPLVRTRMMEPTKEYKNMPAMQPEQVGKFSAGIFPEGRNPVGTIPSRVCSVDCLWSCCGIVPCEYPRCPTLPRMSVVSDS
jgi:NAD(P)-dependent dehydrogenase (short-subunit alcohol dehydrogenase family)